jgi:hypothetical protein
MLLTATLLLLQVPVERSDRSVVPPTHILNVPLIDAGELIIVIVFVVVQPVPNE